MAETGEQFLHRKDTKLHTTSLVEHEQTRKKKAGESTSQKPVDKIAAWLGVIEKTHMGHTDDPRVSERIKDYYHKTFVIKPENVPQSYWNLQGEIAVNEGRKQDLINAGVVIDETTVPGTEVKKRSYTFPEELKEQTTRTILSNQQQSLDRWVDYLISDDAPYPMWAKYWAFRSIVKMGKLEKTEDGRARFATREKNTVASFPVLNQRALANAIGAMSTRLEERGKPKEEQIPIANLSTTLSEADFQKLLSTEDFSQLYAQFLAEIPQYSLHGLEETRGKWIKYDQGSDPTQLVKSLEGHPLEWCTADYDTAKVQIEGGDFYIYYSVDEEGNPIIPRLAIRMEGNRIGEPPRGIAPNQNLDPYISDVLEKKLEEFGSEGQAFRKRTADMRQLTALEKKAQINQPFDAEDLVFIYEIDSPIEGFGYQKDPRIGEIRGRRNPEEDMPVVFGCSRDEIARSVREINADTKAYVGPLERGIFDRLPEGLEYIYTAFPEGKVRRENVGIGGIDFKQFAQELEEKLDITDTLTWEKAGEILKQANAGSVQISSETTQLLSRLVEKQINVSGYVLDMLKNSEFTTEQEPINIDTVRVRVADLGFNSSATTDQIYAKAKELGLELCPAELGPHKRLKDTNQPMDDWEYIAMKQITDRYARPAVFHLVRGGDGLWLYNFWASPDRHWDPSDRFVFGVRKSEPSEPQKLGLFDRLLKR